MKITDNVKRILPAIATALAVTSVMNPVVYAAENIESKDIHLGDTITLSGGYYSDDIIINIPTFDEITADADSGIKKVNKITANYYTAGDNTGMTTVSGTKISSTHTTDDVTISDTADSTVKLGVNESITLPAGYYAKNVTVVNNVVNRGSFSSTQNGSYTNSGYYSSISIKLYWKFRINIVFKVCTIFFILISIIIGNDSVS